MLFHKEKTFFAFRGSLDNNKSTGTNNLIKEFAQIVTDPEDILRKYGLIIIEQNECQIDETIDIPEEYREIYNIITEKPIEIDEIAIKTGIELKKVMQKLTMLELEGKIKKISGNRYIRGE